MGHYNRKATKSEMQQVRRTIEAAFPDCEPVFGCHGDYGGYRAPRDHTIAFRLRDSSGKYRSNVIWLMPDALATLTPADIHRLVDESNGRNRRKG